MMPHCVDAPGLRSCSLVVKLRLDEWGAVQMSRREPRKRRRWLMGTAA